MKRDAANSNPGCRLAALDELCQWLSHFRLTHPMRVAIDGRTAAGKTSLADELQYALSRSGKSVTRTSIDGFHQSRAIRHARGRLSATGYYKDARNLSSVRDCLLKPLGPGGNRFYRTQTFDLDSDLEIQQEPMLADSEMILLVDGSFLLRPELNPYWDARIFVEVSKETSKERGIARDMDRLGGYAQASKLYDERYLPAFDLYQSECDALAAANVVFNNNVFAHPRVNWNK